MVRHANVKLIGEGHSGVDIHGINIAGGTVLHFGVECQPDCITFEGGGVSAAFPSKKNNWDLKCARLEIEGLTFVGYNNTGVDTAAGYSRMKGDTPILRELRWYPADDRHQNTRRDGQRAVVLKKSSSECKPEMFRMSRCCFTDLYVGVEIETCDVAHIAGNWFAQMVYGIRYHNAGQGTTIADNCFADLETAVTMKHLSITFRVKNQIAYPFHLRGIGKPKNRTGVIPVCHQYKFLSFAVLLQIPSIRIQAKYINLMTGKHHEFYF